MSKNSLKETFAKEDELRAEIGLGLERAYEAGRNSPNLLERVRLQVRASEAESTVTLSTADVWKLLVRIHSVEAEESKLADALVYYAQGGVDVNVAKTALGFDIE